MGIINKNKKCRSIKNQINKKTTGLK